MMMKNVTLKTADHKEFNQERKFTFRDSWKKVNPEESKQNKETEKIPRFAIELTLSTKNNNLGLYCLHFRDNNIDIKSTEHFKSTGIHF